MQSPTILIVEDDSLLNRMLADSLEKMGFRGQSASSLAEARRKLNQQEPSLAIVDGRLPDGEGVDLLKFLPETCPAILLTAYGTVHNAVEAMKSGAAEYLLKPVDFDELEMVVRRTLENASIRRDYQFCKKQLTHRERRGKLLVGNSRAMDEVQKLIDAVAPTDMSVLIQGESGTGKELVASELHFRSLRNRHNFVTLDCCTLQEKLFESELFGHERGAFTGADRQKKGLIEGAEQGTLFLDEIGEIEPSIQAKLLRVLETGHYRRLGGNHDLVADVRIVAATNRDLAAMSRNGSFRSDLYYRLNAFVITLPPLRERREDIPSLAENFIRNHTFSRRIEKTVHTSAMKHLVSYDWPGNIRELKNVVERAIILSGDKDVIHLEHLAFCSKGRIAAMELSFDFEPTLEEIEKQYLGILMSKYSGHRAKIAKALGISERNTYRLIKKHELAV